ncbi:hypothetical protein [Pedobacter sp. MW01-1-1]|uniref:hypothetical protein n=1 Tax=Pedobacter sp. MW01-1-1 TaxID=3383027 RepID=UPI003FEFEABA
MTVTVLAILETDFRPDPSLSKLMNNRLQQAAEELQNDKLKALNEVGKRDDDVVVYISFNPKYSIRWRIVNDVAKETEEFVSEVCANMGYIPWKTATLNVFKGNA